MISINFKFYTQLNYYTKLKVHYKDTFTEQNTKGNQTQMLSAHAKISKAWLQKVKIKCVRD